MCERISQLRQAMADYAADYDADLYSVADAEAIVDHAAAIEKMAAAVKAAAAARVAVTSRWRDSGARSPAHRLASVTGVSVAAAADTLVTARRLRRLPTVAAAAAAGRISPAQASAIAGAAEVDPSAQESLLATAAQAPLGVLRDECAATRAAAVADGEARRARIHRERSLHHYTDAEGAFNLHLRHNPEVGARVMAAIEPTLHRRLEETRSAGSGDSAAACGADALVEVLERGAGIAAGPNGDVTGNGSAPRRAAEPKILVRIDLPTLFRGYPIAGETCEVVGFGPVAVSAVRDMIESGNPFLVAVATDGVRVAGVAHLGRRATARQRSALEWLAPRCANIACDRVADLEIDHQQPWAETHFTLLELLEHHCSHDHYLKTHHGWSLVGGTGRRAFVPPDDPRHPANASRPPP